MSFEKNKDANDLNIDKTKAFRVVSNEDGDDRINIGDIVYCVYDDHSTCPYFNHDKDADSDDEDTIIYNWYELEYADEPVKGATAVVPFYVVFNHAYEALHRFKTEAEAVEYIEESETEDLSIFEVSRELKAIKPKGISFETKQVTDWE